MTKTNLTSFRTIFINDFNLCFFVSAVLISLIPDPDEIFRAWPPVSRKFILFCLIPVFNGLITAAVSLLLNHYFTRKNYAVIYYTAERSKLALTAFLAGFCSIYISLSDFGTYLVSLLIIYISAVNVKNFAAGLSQLLAPDTKATPRDLGRFANFFINLLITFTVINLSVNAIHGRLRLPSAFNFGQGLDGILDAVYFSIITMTTVGYGDIIPHTVVARIVVGFECLTSYFILGIMIGIITRGISFNRAAGKPNQK